MSEGALTWSDLDDGNRSNFERGKVAALFQNFEASRRNGIYDREACYPVLRASARLHDIRDRLDTQAPHAPARTAF